MICLKLTKMDNIINTDVTKEIIKYINNDKNIVSLLCVNTITASLSDKYKEIIFKYAIEREIDYIYHIDYLYYYKDNSERQMEKNDRVYTTEGLNYKIIRFGSFTCDMIEVDPLGNDLGKKIVKIGKYPNEHTWKTRGLKNCFEIKSGILLFEGGPLIQNKNSIYLKYKLFRSDVKPEIGMLVTVRKYNDYNTNFTLHHNETRKMYNVNYIITDISEKIMTLSYISDKCKKCKNLTVELLLTANFIDNTWCISNKNHYITYDFYDTY